MKKIYLVRHGQSVANAGGKAQPNQMIELTDLGQEQVHTVSDWIIENIGTDIASIGISRFKRTEQTARPLVNALSIQPTLIEGLEEFDYLSFDKMKDMGLAQRFQASNDFWDEHDLHDAHGDDSESFAMFYNRVEQVLAYFKNLEAGNHIVYTHGLWISMLIWQILGQPASHKKHIKKFRQFEMSIRARNCEVFCLTFADGDLVSLYPPSITKVRTRTDPPTWLRQ